MTITMDARLRAADPSADQETIRQRVEFLERYIRYLSNDLTLKREVVRENEEMIKDAEVCKVYCEEELAGLKPRLVIDLMCHTLNQNKHSTVPNEPSA